MCCAKIGLNCPSSSAEGKDCEKFTDRRTYRYTDERGTIYPTIHLTLFQKPVITPIRSNVGLFVFNCAHSQIPYIM